MNLANSFSRPNTNPTTGKRKVYLHPTNSGPVVQAAGQVHHIDSAVSVGMGSVVESRKMVIQYEDFCHSPARTYGELLERIGSTPGGRQYMGPDKFEIGRTVDVELEKAIENALSTFSPQ